MLATVGAVAAIAAAVALSAAASGSWGHVQHPKSVHTAPGAGIGPAALDPTAPSVRCPDATSLTSLHVVPNSPLNPYPGHPVAVTDASSVRAVFNAACRFVAYDEHPSGAIDCPNDTGLTFAGVFYAGSTPVASFTDHPTGCSSLTMTAGSSTSSSMAMGDAAGPYEKFVDALQKAVGPAEPVAA